MAQDFKVNNDTLSISLYRVAQECLTNVARHARATCVEMRLEITEKHHLNLVVTDNGQGFDPARVRGREALGIAGMMERAELIGALFEIASRPGEGCKVSLEIQSSNWEANEL